MAPPVLNAVHHAWLAMRGYAILGLAGRGRSSGVWRAQKGARGFAVKAEHEKSFRTQMVEREVQMLPLMNAIGVGPRLRAYDVSARLVVMDFVEGIPLAKWIAQCDSKTKMVRVLVDVFAQAARMDAAGLDHGQLGGKLHNILVGPRGKVTILDFEKASYTRKVRNVRKLRADLFHSHHAYARKIASVAGADAELHVLGAGVLRRPY